MSKLVCRSGWNEGDQFALHEGKTVLGRGRQSDVLVFDKECSRRHCRVHKVRNYHVVEDLGSANGTFVNGKRVKGRVTLKEGDVLRLGATELVLDLAPVGDLFSQLAGDMAEDLRGHRYHDVFERVAASAMETHYRHLHPSHPLRNALRSWFHRGKKKR